MIDSHTHLDLCAQPDAELVAAAEAAGVKRMLTIGIDGPSCRAALAAAEAFPQVYAAIGRHPNAAKGFDDADLAIALARETGKPLVIHSRAADAQTLAQLGAEAEGLSVVMHCFSMAARLRECLERGYEISFAGNVTYPSAAELARAAREVPEERLLIETDAPYLTPQAVRRERNQPAYVAHTLAFLAAARGTALAQLDAEVERNAARVFGWG